MEISTVQLIESGERSQERGVGRETIASPEEAARTFEQVLVEQFVGVMTDQLFKSQLSGEEGPGWMKSYGETQRRILTEVLSEHLVENNTFNISQTLLQQWRGDNEPTTNH